MINNRLLSRTARNSSRGGFTLVELLVVIAIIGLLAALAIGPITHTMQIAKENAGQQTTHNLYLADFQYSIDNGTFAGGTDAGLIAQALMKGGYVSDPSIFTISGFSKPIDASATAQAIAQGYIAWDFAVQQTDNSGITTSDPDQLPLIWNTGNTAPSLTGTGPLAMSLGAKNPYGKDGVAVVYKSGSAMFLKVADVTAGTPSVTNFCNASFNTTNTYAAAVGSGGSTQ